MFGVPPPGCLDELLDPTWLTAALNDLGPDERVVEAAFVESSQTIASKVRFRAVVAGPDGSRSIRSYCAKSEFDDSAAGGFVAEARVYRDLLPTLDLRTPRAYYTGIDEASGRAMIIMDDVVACGGTFLDAFTPFSVATTQALLAQLARVHAATWGETALADLEYLASEAVGLDRYPVALLQQLLDDGRAEGLAPELRDAERLREAFRQVLEPTRICVIHGDPHSGNAYLDNQGRPSWLDWQVCRIGHWAMDVGYHLATVLDVDTRQVHEKELLRGYLDELERLGQQPPSFDEAWDLLPIGIVYGYFFWVITRISSRAVVLTHMPRLGAAVLDHHALEYFGV